MKLRELIFTGLLGTSLLGGCTGNIIEPESALPGTPGAKPPGATPGTNPGGPASPAGPAGPSEPGMVPAERPNEPAPGVKPPGSAVHCEAEVIAPRVLRRLTNNEIEATIRTAFGLDTVTWKGPSFIPDPASSDGFTNNSDRLTVGDEVAKRIVEAGKDVAEIVTSATQLPRIVPCAAVGGDACATQFVDSVGPKLFRRPLTAAEKERYVALSRKVKAQGGDFKAFVYWATVALIKSPNTVYRSELGEPAAGKFKLTNHEIASALSYAFTGGPPPPELMQLATANRLGTADDVEAAARTLIYAPDGQLRPAFKAQVLRFADQWLGLSPLANINKDKTVFADFSPEVQDALVGEIQAFLSGVLFENKGKPADLLTAPYTYVNATLAKFYGYGQAAGPDFVRAQRPANWGVGLMSQGAILTLAAANNSTSPTKRGHLVRERLLCTVVPPPPKAVAPIPEPTAAQTTRQRYEQIHVAVEECKGCHALMDPIGFGLEKLDGVGRVRTKEGQFDIDDSGVLASTSKGDIKFSGGQALAEALATLPEVSDCMADFASAYTFGLNHTSAACLARQGTEDLRQGKISIVDFFLKMARAESFRVRNP